MKKLIFILLLSGCAVQEPSNNLLAEQYLDFHEQDNNHPLGLLLGVDPVQTEWCAAFVTHILKSEGKPIAEKPFWSRSYLDWGTAVDTPQVGDLVIFSRNGSAWQGHIGFFVEEVSKNGKDYYKVLGGNQSDRVGYGLYNTDELLGIRRYN